MVSGVIQPKTSKECQKFLKRNLEILDEIDFIPYLQKCTNINMIYELVQDNYNESELTKNDICEGLIFNWLDMYDFMNYLLDRYQSNLLIYEPEQIYNFKYYEIR